jgi:hypothetical protein
MVYNALPFYGDLFRLVNTHLRKDNDSPTFTTLGIWYICLNVQCYLLLRGVLIKVKGVDCTHIK